MKITSLDEIPVVSTTHGTGKKKVLIPKGTLPHLKTFSQVKFAPGEVVEEHTHTDMSEIFLIEEGEALITVDHKEYRVKPGTCMIVEPGEAHAVVNIGKTPLIMTYFGLYQD